MSLSAADAADALAELMPPAIEGFFLFDGELLDQYEKLVDDEPISGSALREAIEQVLGIPLIASAAKDVRAIAEEAEKAIADAAKQVRETNELGVALGQAQDVAREYRKSRDEEDERITALTIGLREVEETLAAQTNNLALLGRREQHRSRISELKQELESAKAALQGQLGSSLEGTPQQRPHRSRQRAHQAREARRTRSPQPAQLSAAAAARRRPRLDDSALARCSCHPDQRPLTTLGGVEPVMEPATGPGGRTPGTPPACEPMPFSGKPYSIGPSARSSCRWWRGSTSADPCFAVLSAANPPD